MVLRAPDPVLRCLLDAAIHRDALAAGNPPDYDAGKENAMLELTAEQHQAIAANGAQPVRAIDPATQTEYVLLRAEIYDRIKNLVSADADWLEGAYLASMEVFAKDGWDDPRMDVYDALDPRKSS
jgi:hypothetical protein